MKYKFEWVNGSEIVEGSSVKNACSNLTTDVNKIVTGMIVSVKELRDADKPQGKKGITLTKWWDAEVFWKYLKKAQKSTTLSKKKAGHNRNYVQ